MFEVGFPLLNHRPTLETPGWKSQRDHFIINSQIEKTCYLIHTEKKHMLRNHSQMNLAMLRNMLQIHSKRNHSHIKKNSHNMATKCQQLLTPKFETKNPTTSPYLNSQIMEQHVTKLTQFSPQIQTTSPIFFDFVSILLPGHQTQEKKSRSKKPLTLVRNPQKKSVSPISTWRRFCDSRIHLHLRHFYGNLG